MEGFILTLIWVALSIGMLWVADVASFRLKRQGWRRFISTFLFFFSQVIVTEFVLGVFSLLTGKAIVILNLIVSGALLYWLQRRTGKKLLSDYCIASKQALKNLWHDIRSDPLLMVLTALAGLLLLWIFFLGVIFPAIDYDGNSYHLTFIGQVMQNHNFFDVPTSIKWLAGYPKGGEFIQLWSVIVSKSDMFTDLAQLPFLAMGLYALYEIGQRLGISKRQSRFAALLFIFLPIVLNQLKTTYVDVMLCTLFFASIAMVLQKKLSNLDLVILGIIFSLIISIKATGLLFVAAVVPLLLYNLYENSTKHHKKQLYWPSYIKPLLIIAIPTIFGLYWYIKNWVIYGSPLYPFGFKLLGHHIFPGQTFQEFAANAVTGLQGLPKSCAARIWFVWTEQKDWFGCLYNYDTNFAGLGPIWFVLLIPASLMAGYVALRERRYKLIAVAATFVGLFAVYPTNYYSRYTMFITALGVLAFGIVLDKLGNLYQIIAKSLAILLVVSVILTNFTLCNYPPLVVKHQLEHINSNEARGPVYDINPGPAFVFLEGRLNHSDVVVYDSKPYFIYPLWRPDFANKVLYIDSRSEADWLQKLKAEHTTYVFTTVWSKENKWARKNLKPVYKDKTYEIYQAN